MSNIIKEQLIEGQHNPIPLKGVKKIEEQMEKCVSQIYTNENKGTGFICKISDNLYVLITNNHILNEEDIEENKIIDISINNKSRKIKMDKNRKKYTNEEIDITIIEIRQNEDEIYEYLEIDEEDIKEKEDNLELEYRNKSIYMIHYPRGELSLSCGVIKELKERKIIEHVCSTEEGSSGSPIMSLKTYKVIGIHYCGEKDKTKNYGIFIKYAIDKFIDNNIYKNEINIQYKVKEKGNIYTHIYLVKNL